jgi:hypothetical protein
MDVLDHGVAPQSRARATTARPDRRRDGSAGMAVSWDEIIGYVGIFPC